MCDLVVLNMWDVVWCAVPEVVRCGMYNALPLHLAPHRIITTTFHSASFHTVSDIPSHTTFHWRHAVISHHIKPVPLTPDYSTLQYHTSNRTILATSHLALHPIFTLLTYHTTPHFMYSTPHLCIEPPHLAHHTRFYKLHRISHAPHILHSLHHIWSWSHPVPHPTTMFHITFHIAHQYTTTSTSHHLSHMAQNHHVSRRVTAHTLPHSTSHNVLHSMPQHTHTNPYYTTTFHNPHSSMRDSELYVIRFVLSFTQPFIPHNRPTQKW